MVTETRTETFPSFRHRKTLDCVSVVSSRTILLVGAIVLCSCGFFHHTFPTEKEIKDKIHAGMTREEVIRVLGQPSNEHVIDARMRTATYVPVIALLDKPERGYIGFVVNYENDVVRDWRILIGDPSYDPGAAGPPSEFKWWAVFYGAVFFLLMLLRRFVRFATHVTERKRMLRSFAKMEIPSRLPADFAFVTRQTKFGEVMDRAGPPTRVIEFPVSDDEVYGYPGIKTASGQSAIRVFQYDLPYSGSLLILPEYPFDRDSLIRAVYHWSDTFNPPEESEQGS